MFVLKNLLSAIVYVLDTLLWLYMLIVFIACLISWFRPDPYNPVVRFMHNLTEPAFWRIRRWFPFVYIRGIDFAPLFLLIALRVVQIFVIGSLDDFIRLL